MGLNQLTILTHTHTDCKTLWDPYFDSYQEFFNDCEHIVLINKYSDNISNKQIIYSEETKYSNRLIEALNQIKTEYVLISFEDMILYDKVDTEKLSSIIDMMSTNEEYFFTRLIKSGIRSSSSLKDNLFLMNSSDFMFSITPTVWRRSMLLSALENLQHLSIWDLETNGDTLLKNNNIKSLYYYDNEKPRGGHHDSTIYPHICSAIVKGKWNMREYSEILSPIIKKYNIDINEKGVF